MTYRRYTEALNICDLVPNALAEVESIDMGATVTGLKLGMPVYRAPSASQRLFHHHGERAVAKAATRYDSMFRVLSWALSASKKLP